MKIEKFKKAKDIQIGDTILSNDETYARMTVRDMLKSEKQGHVILTFDDDFVADIPEDAFVLMPNSHNAKMYILQPTPLA